MKKVCIITCYFDMDYVRGQTLSSALSSNDNLETISVKNTHRNWRRYPEVLLGLIKVRLKHRPDVYVLTFRGQEILPLVLLLVWPKKVIFDEFIVPLAWARQEGHRNTLRTRIFKTLARMSTPLYKMWLKSCPIILADTEVHAKLSAELSGLPISKYQVVPVSADEQLFKPLATSKKSGKDFTVFFYGSKMTPLHGLPYILEAASRVAKTQPRIKFLIAGGDKVTEQIVKDAAKNGARVEYRKWIPLNELPAVIHKADLCLGGPFGDTPQARRVVTGKTYQFLACGAPTVVGKNEATAQLADKKECLKVGQANADELAQKITWAYEHPKELQKIAVGGREAYVNRYSSGVVKTKLNDIIGVI